MTTRNTQFKMSVLALAVASACAATAARAEDDVAALTMPANSMSLGLAGTAESGSAKFGEYNGLNRSQTVQGTLNLDLRGGSAYGDQTGVGRWSVQARDLGNTSQELKASYSEQGQWFLGIGQDNLTHNLSDTYKSPYIGYVGGSNFTLPTGFVVPGSSGSATSTNLVYNPLSGTQLGMFNQEPVSTTRENTSLTAGINLTPRWDLKFDFNHLQQTGGKLQAVSAYQHTAQNINGQVISILPMPTDYTTDTLNFAASWVGDGAGFTAGYFASFFNDANDRIRFQTWGNNSTTSPAATEMQNLAMAPSNIFHQLNLSGNYRLSPTTKLVSSFSYGMNTQNTPFVDPNTNTSGSAMVANSPMGSLDGLIVSKHFDARLSEQSSKQLALSATLKFDERDNMTQSNFYNFNAVDGGNTANYPNTPLSYKKDQLELAGDYMIKKDQHFRLAYTHDDVTRWCSSYATGVGSFTPGVNCVVATSGLDDKLDASYRIKLNNDVSVKTSYSIADRETQSDPRAVAAFIGLLGNYTPGMTGAVTGVAGRNAGDLPGFHPYFDASRIEQVMKLGTTIQAGEQTTLGAAVKYVDDQYNTTYGVKNGSAWSVDLDATFAYAENGAMSAYFTQQHRQRDMSNFYYSYSTSTLKYTQANWKNELNDDDVTVGLGFKHGGLLGGKFELAGDLTYTAATTSYNTQAQYQTNGTAFVCNATVNMTCGSLPGITSESTQIKVKGTYSVDKKSSVAMQYLWQTLATSDFYYNGLQNGYTPTALLPTNQTSPKYVEDLITLVYTYKF